MSDHLIEEVAPELELGVEERIQRIRAPRVIGYPRAKEIVAEMEDLFRHLEIHRVPNLLLVGASNNGKTVIANSFAERMNQATTEEQHSKLPVVYVQAPPYPDERRFFSALLFKLCAPHKRNERPEYLAQQAMSLLRGLGTKMLMVDEIQHVLAGTPGKQRVFMNVLKSFGNEMKIPIVGLGTRDALIAVQSDEQIENRFRQTALPKWSNDDGFRRLLASFEARLPLRHPSDLADDAMASRLLTLCGGLIGELSTLLRKAAERAVRGGKERITRKIIDELGWVPPADRRREAAKVV